MCFALLLLTSCGSASEHDVSPTTEAATTQAVESLTQKDVVSANESYGRESASDGISVKDRSVLFRTADSYAFEPTAICSARDMLKKTLADPNSLEIQKCHIISCADDGKCTYYTIYLYASYIVGSGDRIESGNFYNIGVHKSDKTAFDASDEIEDVLEAYSIFRQTPRNAEIPYSADETDPYDSAARQIALSRLKKAESGKAVSAKQNMLESEGDVSVWDVLCEGENDFGMFISDVYKVSLREDSGKIVEIDPDE